MIPPSFDYHRASSVEDALEHLADGAVVLAGGHSLLPDMKARAVEPSAVVDVGGLGELRGVDGGDGAGVRVGATTTFADAADSDVLWNHVPVLAEAAANVGDVQIRNCGTVGGNLAACDPGSDVPAAAVAGDATMALRGTDGRREVPADEFFQDGGETAVGGDELLTSVGLPAAHDGGAYVKKTHPATGYALVGVAVTVAVEDGVVTDARVAANGATAGPTRLRSVEESLVDVSAAHEDAVADATRDAAAGVDPDALRSDVEASGEFRAHLLDVYGARAVRAAVDRAR